MIARLVTTVRGLYARTGRARWRSEIRASRDDALREAHRLRAARASRDFAETMAMPPVWRKGDRDESR